MAGGIDPLPVLIEETADILGFLGAVARRQFNFFKRNRFRCVICVRRPAR